MNQNLFQGDVVDSSRILYTPTQFAKEALLHIQEIGSLQAQRAHISKRENLESYLFFTVQTGSGTLFYKDTTYSLVPGDCVFINCRHKYYHQTAANDLWQLSWVHFDGPTAAAIYSKYIERGGSPVFHPRNLPKYQSILNNLYNIASGSSHVRDMEINTELSSLLTVLMQDAWPADNSVNQGKKNDLLSLKNYLDSNFTEKITLDDLAQRYYINKFYLTRIFKEQFGTSINNYLLDLRITRAKSLLRFSDLTADAIGLECGIGSGYYFSRVFKQVEGISPSEYRKRWRTG